jgi:type IV secretory pathway TrbF-like protein
LKEKKTKVKVWVDIDKVVKASSTPKKLKWYEKEMIVVPKGEKASS